MTTSFSKDILHHGVSTCDSEDQSYNELTQGRVSLVEYTSDVTEGDMPYQVVAVYTQILNLFPEGGFKIRLPLTPLYINSSSRNVFTVLIVTKY